MGLNHSPRIVTDGLVLCLDAANARSYPGAGTTWADLKGEYTGTLTNMDASNFSSENGGVLDFDGTNEYITFGVLDGFITQDVSVSAWIYTRANNGRIISHGWNFTNAETGWVVHLGTSHWTSVNNEGSATWMSADGFSNYNAAACVQSDANSIPTNQWLNITTTKSGANVVIYLNNTPIKTGTVPSNVAVPSNRTLSIGTNIFDGDAGSYFYDKFNGKIGVISLYNRALTADEVRQNYQATVGRYV